MVEMNKLIIIIEGGQGFTRMRLIITHIIISIPDIKSALINSRIQIRALAQNNYHLHVNLCAGVVITRWLLEMPQSLRRCRLR